MNGYFQLVIDEKSTSIKLVPETDDGEKIQINELLEYLQSRKIGPVDIKILFSALQNLRAETIIPITNKPVYEESESFKLEIAADLMSAVIRFYPPSTNGHKFTKDDILNDLKYKRVIHGIKEDSIDEFLVKREYCKNYEIAVGTPPIHGCDAVIEYYFNTDLNTKPARNEDGSVDFFHLNTINHCKVGDLLAKLTPATQGQVGYNITGEKIKPRDVKNLVLSFGNNIACSEDRNTLTSMLNGHVSLVGNKVFVSDVFEVENVGTSTGNIESTGSVIVNQNVQAGFSVKATGNVEVRGVVEGATIEAGGDIIIARGMNGMGKGILIAGGRVISKFIENATVTCGEYVTADCILHSNVNAKTEIICEGKKGLVAGGMIRATNLVSCKTLGSKMGVDTIVEVGVDPAVKSRYTALQKEIFEIEKNIKNIQPILLGATQKLKSGETLAPEQLKYIQSLALANQQQQEQLKKDREEFLELEVVLNGRANASVVVKDEAFQGTKIVIADASLTLKSGFRYCRFIYDHGDVKLASL